MSLTNTAVVVRKYHRTWECGSKEWKERIPVRIMATAEGYAMVRGKNEIPFVVDEMELQYDNQGVHM